MHFIDTFKRYLGWCPDRHSLYEGSPRISGQMKSPDAKGPGGTGGPRNPGPFRVPGDMLGMLIDPAGTIRRSKNAPMTWILGWFGALVVANALLLGAVTYYALNMTDFEQTVGPVFRIGMFMVTGEIGLSIVIIGSITAVVHFLSRIAGRNSTIPMALRVVLFGATPVLLFSWTFWAGPTLVHSLFGIEIHEAATAFFYANILFIIWAILLIGIGFGELHGMAVAQTDDESYNEVN